MLRLAGALLVAVAAVLAAATPLSGLGAKQIAFSVQSTSDFDVWIVRLDGSGQRRLCCGPAGDGYDDSAPAWIWIWAS